MLTTTSASSSPRASALEALYATGHWLHGHDRFADASSVFRAMIHLAPEDERGWLGLGTCCEALGADDTALDLYDAATAEVDAPRCELARARILRRQGREREARSAIAAAARVADRHRDHELRLLVAAEQEVSP